MAAILSRPQCVKANIYSMFYLFLDINAMHLFEIFMAAGDLAI